MTALGSRGTFAFRPTGRAGRRQAAAADASARLRRLWIVAACAATMLVGAGCGAAAPGEPLAAPAAAALPASSSSHVAVIVMENKESGEVTGSSSSRYVNALARRYASATASYAITHPSLPNYLALTSGSTNGITSDCTDCHVAAPNIVDQLVGAHLSWRAYMEGLPSPCSQVAHLGRYAKKHNPFVYYDDVASNPRRCRNVVGFDQLSSDLRRGRLPTFAFITPDLCHDTHDCDVATGDRFLAGLVPRLLRELGPHGFLVLTWDEGSSRAGCCTDAHGGKIATIVAGPDVRRHATSSRPVDHYGVLRTIEHALRLPALGGAAQPRNGSLDSLFAHAPHVR
jgi:phosphatidylinositol-3-phosphatase